MEVHKHPHHVTIKKKWLEYLLEFLMIFFAVFLGFIAENIRENFTEKSRITNYLKAYSNDLVQNKIKFIHFDSLYKLLLPVYDSITKIYYEKTENKDLPILASLLIRGKRNIPIPINTGTYAQLINSGNMRLIEDKGIIDGIIKYNDEINRFKEYDEQIKSLRYSIYPNVLKIEDLHDFYRYDNQTKKILIDHLPIMDSFPHLTDDQRKILVNYYKIYVVQTNSEISMFEDLIKNNEELYSLNKSRSN